MTTSPNKLPKTLAACADRLFKLKAEKAAAQAKVEAIDEERKALEAHLIASLPKSDATGVAGKLARVTVVSKLVPQAADWPKIHAHIKRTGSFDLLQRRLNDAAVRERWEAGNKLPGVDAFEKLTISLNKV